MDCRLTRIIQDQARLKYRKVKSRVKKKKVCQPSAYDARLYYRFPTFMIRPRDLDYENYQVARSLAEYSECAERLLRLD